VSRRRADGSRRVTPDLIGFHKANALALREAACRDARRRLRLWLRKLLRRHHDLQR
jgi:hypothetical protein